MDQAITLKNEQLLTKIAKGPCQENDGPRVMTSALVQTLPQICRKGIPWKILSLSGADFPSCKFRGLTCQAPL